MYEEIRVESIRSKINNITVDIIEVVVGKDNIDDVDLCITRIRLKLRDGSDVDKIKLKLKQIGIAEIIRLGSNNVQIIIGTMAYPVVSRMRTIIIE